MQKFLSSIVLAVLGLSATLALAEKADSFQALTIDADQVTVDEIKKTSVFTGHVVIGQGSLLVKAEKVIYRQDQDGDDYQLTAYGAPINFRQKQDNSPDYIEAYAEQLEFNSKLQQARLLRKATLRLGKDEVRGETIFYDMRTQRYEVKGGAKTTENPKGDRIRVIIQPRKKADTSTQAPALAPDSVAGGAKP